MSWQQVKVLTSLGKMQSAHVHLGPLVGSQVQGPPGLDLALASRKPKAHPNGTNETTKPVVCGGRSRTWAPIRSQITILPPGARIYVTDSASFRLAPPVRLESGHQLFPQSILGEPSGTQKRKAEQGAPLAGGPMKLQGPGPVSARIRLKT